MKYFGRLLALRKIALRAFVAVADRRVPRRLKLIAAGAVLLILSPVNLLGDIPLLGIVDDAGLLGLVLLWFTRAAEPYLRTFDA